MGYFNSAFILPGIEYCRNIQVFYTVSTVYAHSEIALGKQYGMDTEEDKLEGNRRQILFGLGRE
jgi:hypothetical protein